MNPKTAGSFDEHDRLIPYEPPDWFVAMRNCRYLGEPFCQTMGVPYGPIVEAWTLTAQSAENEAQETVMRRGSQ